MSNLNLVKGEKLALTKENPGLKVVKLGLGWKPNAGNGGAFDLDASAFLIGADGKVIGPGLSDSVVYFGNLNLPGVSHSGDNLTGDGDGDDEVITVNLDNVGANVARIVLVVNIYQADTRRQNFGQVQDAFIRLVNDSNQQEISRFDLTEDHSASNNMTMAELYRAGTEWKFGAIERGGNGDLNAMLASYC